MGGDSDAEDGTPDKDSVTEGEKSSADTGVIIKVSPTELEDIMHTRNYEKMEFVLNLQQRVTKMNLAKKKMYVEVT